MISGSFELINRHLVIDLCKLNLWNEKIRNLIILERGSIQNIEEIPQRLRAIYKTAWEIPVRTILEYSAERGRFIDQSQSLNLFVADPNYAKLSSIHFYSWRLGLKTGMYFLRTKPASNPIQFTVNKECTANKECTSCGS